MEIKAKCKLDMKAMKALTYLGMYKKADPQKRMRFWAVSYAILFVVILLEMLLFGADFTLIMLAVAEVGIFLLLCDWYVNSPKRKYNALGKLKDAENEYTFCEESMKAVTNTNEYKGEAEIRYTLFSRVYETSQYFFLWQMNRQVYMVDKSTIAGGTVEDIRRILMHFLGKRYVLCNY